MKKKKIPQQQPASTPLPAETSQPIPAATAHASVSPAYQRWMPLLLFLLAFLLYAPTITYQYAFDDAIVITENQFTKQGIRGIDELVTRDFFEGIYGQNGMNLTGGRYRPLSLFMFAIEYQLFGLNPTAGHLINVLLYALSVLLLFSVLSRWFGKDSIVPLVASLFFVVHPIHTEVVANIKSRDEILALLLLLTTIHALHLFITRAQTKWLFVAALAFFGAMLSKESAFTFMLVIPLSLWVFGIHTPSQRIPILATLSVTAVLYLVLRTAMLGSGSDAPQTDLLENPLYGTTWNERLGTVAVYMLQYWKLLFLPYPLSCDYSFNHIPVVEMSNLWALVSIALHLSLASFVVWKLPQKHPIAWAAIAILAPLSPAVNLFFNVGAPMGERFLYIASLGFCVAVAWGLAQLAKDISLSQFLSRPALLGVVLALAVVAGGWSFQRNKVWYNNETLFESDVQIVPNSAKIHYYYGNTLLKKYIALSPEAQTAQKDKLLPKIEAEMQRAVDIYPNFHTAIYNLGLVAYQKPDPQKAIEYWNKTLELVNNHVMSLQMLGEVYARYLNQPDKSLEYTHRLIDEAKITDDYSIWQTMGIAYAMKNNPQKALECLDKAIKIAPNNAEIWHNMGAIYGNMGNTAKANECINKAQQLRAK